MSTVSADQVAVDEKLIRINGGDYWLYGAVDPEIKEIVQLRLFQAATKKQCEGF
jgi:transposase-like protein